jgi:protein O-mannosyl-transferase
VREKQRAMLLCLLLALITLGLYAPALHFDFINYDDPDYVVYNPAVQHGVTKASLTWAFTSFHASNWHPLTWISHMVDYSLYGARAGGHHVTNVLLHTVNVVLLFLLLWRWTDSEWRSALVAALFAWHPLHVESVAWISERKDLLGAFFWMLALMAYGRYARGDGPWRKLFYAPALVCFALGLLSKPMVVTLPVVLFLLDFWPLRRAVTTWLFLEKIPFLALAVVAGVMTFRAQRAANSIISFDALPIAARVANALVSCVLYLWKTIWPADLALPYPYTRLWTFWPAAGAAFLILAITAVAIRRRRWQRFLLVGWLWFLVTLVPVIGLVQVGSQYMADRYSYLPLIGIFIMVAWAVPAEWTRWPKPGLVFGAVLSGVLVFLLAQTETQLGFWSDSVTLFSHTVAVTRNNILAEYNLGEALARRGDEAQAINHYQWALVLQPSVVEAQSNPQEQARFNLGLIFLKQKRWALAAEQFRAFLRDNPNLARAHKALGLALQGLGRESEAKEQFEAAARLP